MLITLYKKGEVRFPWLGTNGFHVKAKNDRFIAASSRCRQNLKYENFTSSFGRLHQNIAPKSVADYVWQTTSKHCTEKRAACAALLSFFIQPIKSLICGVVVDVAVVKPPKLGSFSINREFKKLWRQLQGKRHIKIELCVKLSLNLSDYSMLITLYKIDGVHFRLLGTDG